MYRGVKVEQLPADQVGTAAGHPYSRLLMSSVPKLDPNWLDKLERDPELVATLLEALSGLSWSR